MGGKNFCYNKTDADRKKRCCVTSGEMERVRCLVLALVFLFTATPSYGQEDQGAARITEGPHDMWVGSEKTAVLSCRAAGSPPPRIFWHKAGRKIVPDRNLKFKIKEMNGWSTLRISPVRFPRDDTRFECVAENSKGADTASMKLSVYPPDEELPQGYPQITDHPQLKSVETDSTTLLRCLVLGAPDPEVSWLKDSSPVDLGDERYSLMANGFLKITRAQQTDSGSYECVAENKYGVVYSQRASLYVKDRRVPPHFSIRPPRKLEVIPGSGVNITCVAVGSPMPYVKWTWGDEVLTPEALVGRVVLQLRDLQENMNVTCEATTTLGIITATTSVILVDLPSPPIELATSRVEDTTLRLRWEPGRGHPASSYVVQWRPLGNDTWGIDEGLTTLDYELKGLMPFTQYELRVAGANVVGRGRPSTAIFTKTHIAAPGSAPENVRAYPISSMSIMVNWKPPKIPNGNIKFYRVYYRLEPSKVPDHLAYQHKDTSSDVKFYSLESLRTNATYLIRVSAFTSVGEGPRSAPISVRTDQGVPNIPLNLRVIDWSATTITLHWDAPQHGKNLVIEYIILYNFTLPDGRRTQSDQQLTGSPLTTYQLKDLIPGTLYSVKVAAKAARGRGLPTPVKNQTTKEFSPSSAPDNVTVSAVSPGTLLVTWDAPPRDTHNGQLTGFVVRYWREGDEAEGSQSERVQGADVRRKKLVQLRAYVRYCVRVAAATNAGAGPPARAVCQRTVEGVPGEPRKVKVEVLNSTAVRVSWKPPPSAEQNGIIQGYQVHYRSVNHSSWDHGIPMMTDVEGDKRSVVITGLKAKTKYEFQVAAYTRRGDGLRSRGQEKTTTGAVPDPPEGLKVSVEEGGEGSQQAPRFRISWELPAETHGVLLNYKVEIINNETNIPVGAPTITGASELSVMSEILSHGVAYRVSVSARNRNDYGLPAVKTRITPDGAPPPPRNIAVERKSPHECHVTWEIPISPVSGYQLLYVHARLKDNASAWQHLNLGAIHDTDVGGLEPNAEYYFRLKSQGRNGQYGVSSPYAVLHEGSSRRNSAACQNLRATRASSSSIELYWERPRHTGDIVFYAIRVHGERKYRDENGAQKQKDHLLETVYDPNAKAKALLRKRSVEPLRAKVSGLEPAVRYNVSVTAVYDADVKGVLPNKILGDRMYGPWANISVSTLPAAPPAPPKPRLVGNEGGENPILEIPRTSEIKGDVISVMVIVVPEDKTDTEPQNMATQTLQTNSPAQLLPYIAGELNKKEHDFPYRFPLGGGKVYGGYTNAPILSRKNYKVFIRAFTSLDKTLFNSSEYSQAVNTNSQPPSPVQANPVGGGTKIMTIAIPVGCVILLILLIVIIVVIARKRCRKPARQPDKNKAVEMPLLATNGTPASPGKKVQQPTLTPAPGPSDPVEQRRATHQTPGMMSHPPIPTSQLADHIDILQENENYSFLQEYESIEPGQQFTWDHSNMEVNKPKNRYANVIAYDHSRVVLQPIDGVPCSDYINANYMDGYRKQNAYIATQGPLPETFGDFWRMVWEQRAAIIVMMTRLEERQRIKCDQYWPSRGADTYGFIHVTLADVSQLAFYTVRTFHIQRHGSGERREVRQYQFTAWPDHGVPDTPTPLLLFLRRVKAANPPDAGPLLVHCSAGVGRTGAFIVIDAMLERARHEKTVDIYGHVTCLRAQRNYTVQTDDQYMFIHGAVLEAVLSGSTEVPARSLGPHLASIIQAAPHGGPSVIEMEFKRLASLKATSSKFVSANLPVNKFKNRLVNILPYESSRVSLQPIRGVEGSDYINASFIDGYRSRRAYIATQGPLMETTDDLWRMLWEQNSTLVVMLTRLREMGREKCHQYWPSERSARYQYFVVDPVAEYNMPQYILREFKVTDARDGQSRTVRQFQFTDWPEQGVPKSAEGFLDLIGQVHKTKEQFGLEGPITVHCSAGVGRTGVFVALSVALDTMRYEGLIDLFTVIKLLRSQRPAMVQSEDQYDFCYRAALEYLSSFDHYTS